MSSLFPSETVPVLYRDVKCSKCSQHYKNVGLRTSDRLQSTHSSLSPLLLSCGHAVCERCVGRSRVHICTRCDEKTKFQIGTRKSKHLYLVGLLEDTQSYLREAKHQCKNKTRSEAVGASSIWPLLKGICQECSISKATVQCRNCAIEVCLSCFQKIHSYRSLKKHKPEPLNVPDAVLSCLLPECIRHPQNTATMQCLTCTTAANKEKYFCTGCDVNEEHQGHEIADMNSLMKQHLPELHDTMDKIRDAVVDLRNRVKYSATTQPIRIYMGVWN
ncbi:hypothetical protein SK128_023717 [Halocaridina rubra]|uniref:B box-type domain-containing protein n=1 Tax=Halocaridina rubra TaxID=373956 RepID=A0AAN8WYX5_HALRR